MVFPLYWADTHFGNGRSLWRWNTQVVPYWCDLWTANAPTVIFTGLNLKSNWGSLDLSVHREAINKSWISFTLPELGVKFRHSTREIFLNFTCQHLITNTIVCEKVTIVLTVVIFRFDEWLPEIKIHCSCRKLTETEIDAHLVSIAERDWRFDRRLHDNKQPFVTCFKNISINRLPWRHEKTRLIQLAITDTYTKLNSTGTNHFLLSLLNSAIYIVMEELVAVLHG